MPFLSLHIKDSYYQHDLANLHVDFHHMTDTLLVRFLQMIFREIIVNWKNLGGWNTGIPSVIASPPVKTKGSRLVCVCVCVCVCVLGWGWGGGAAIRTTA